MTNNERTVNERIVNVLNHLLAIHYRSLPVYLESAQPWTRRPGEPAIKVLREIAEHHHHMVERIGELIIENEGVVRYGEIPMRFADWHDLSVDFHVARAIECQHQDIDRIEKCVQWLEGAPRAKALAEEALGEAKGHLESLLELRDKPAAA